MKAALLLRLKPAVQGCFSGLGCAQKHLVGFFKGCGYSVSCATQLLLLSQSSRLSNSSRLSKPSLSESGYEICLGCSPGLVRPGVYWLALPLAEPPGSHLPLRAVAEPVAGGTQEWLSGCAVYLHLRKVALASHPSARSLHSSCSCSSSTICDFVEPAQVLAKCSLLQFDLQIFIFSDVVLLFLPTDWKRLCFNTLMLNPHCTFMKT